MTRLPFTDDLAERVRGELASGATAVAIDLGGVACIDPAGMRRLAAAAEVARGAGATLRFEGASPLVYKALHVASVI